MIVSSSGNMPFNASYMAEETTIALLAMLKQSATSGVAVEVRDFSPASPVAV
jgi:hypothetical protein